MAEEGRRQGFGAEESNETGPGMEGYWMLCTEITTNYVRNSNGEDRVILGLKS